MNPLIVDTSPIEKAVNGGKVRLIQGDITALDVEAIVYYARPDLKLGAGFGNAIAVRGGPKVQEALNGTGPLPVGEAVITEAGNLKARYLVHAVGPRFQEPDTEPKLRATVLTALRRADEKGARTVALPAMGAGFYGVPLAVCARVMLDAIQEYLGGDTGLREVVICLNDRREFAAFSVELRSRNRRDGGTVR